jgi:hypothetical protein
MLSHDMSGLAMIIRPIKKSGGADALPLFCFGARMIRKSGIRFSEKIMRK